jgi:hypothetical protein
VSISTVKFGLGWRMSKFVKKRERRSVRKEFGEHGMKIEAGE